MTLDPGGAGGVGGAVDSDIGRVMKHLLKQSASTKLKALQELIDTVAGEGAGQEERWGD